MLINLISQIYIPELKEEYLNKQKKKKTTIEGEHDKKNKTKIGLDETLEIFNKKKSKEVTINDLQHEIGNIKKEIIEFKNELKDIRT